MPESSTVVAEQFNDARQQREATTLGMWTFLATEVLFFGGLFLAYTVYRFSDPRGFAIGSRHTDLFFGTLNTVILLTSSLTMALAVRAIEENRIRSTVRHLLLTLGLAVAFLVVKAFEYHKDFVERLVPGPSFAPELPSGAQLFFYLYWVITGLHAFHVLAGIGMLTVLTLLARRGSFSSAWNTPVEMGGLYWHFVDIVWIFIYPLLYLISRHA